MRCLRNDLRFLRGLRRVMNHRVGVFYTHTVSAALLFEDSHERVVVLFVFPIALPLRLYFFLSYKPPPLKAGPA